MKAIQIKYIGPTDTKGSHYKAMAEGNDSLCVSYDHGISDEQQARELAQLYCNLKDWGQVYGFGCLPNGDYVATLGE